MKFLKILVLILIPYFSFAQYAEGGEVYFKGVAGYGIKSEGIDTGIGITEEDGNYKEIYIYPGGGLNIEWGMGVHITSSLRTEIEVSYQSSGDRFGNGSVIFRKFPAGLSIVKEYQNHPSYLLYFKTGLLGIFTPKYFDELHAENEVNRLNVDYKSSIAGQIAIGLMRRIESEKLNIFVELKYVTGQDLEWKSATLNKKSFEISDEYRSLPNKGLFLNVGLGYYY